MKVYTIGQVSKICKVNPRITIKWFDTGRLKGYRIPGSQDRRIPHEYLIKFLTTYGFPLGKLATKPPKNFEKRPNNNLSFK